MNYSQHDELYKHSIRIILENQATSGGYLASPNFPSYRYSWFRDGSFIAYSMDLAGEVSSTRSFHDWAAGVINQRSEVIQKAIQKASSGEQLSDADQLHTRYQLDGSEGVGQEWPNFQLDGFGTWLWSVGEHIKRNSTPLHEHWRCAADLIAAYVAALWSNPCYDCWEEFPDQVHTYTLAALYAGLSSHMQISGKDHTDTLQTIRRFILERCVLSGHFVKFPGSSEVDASLLGLSVPYGVVTPQDPIMRETVLKIEENLQTGGGVHRYPSDTYYGGGEWLLLTAWLGWYQTMIGDPDSLEKAGNAFKWLRDQAGRGGGPWELPEQVPDNLWDPAYYSPWVDRWGPVATPLLWSHAKYMILAQALYS
jgi:GH15 family glucan-1,4-alpha-glucosidase